MDDLTRALGESAGVGVSGLVAERARRSTFGEREQLLALAEGRPDLVTLGRGDPDLPTPPHVVEAAKRALDLGDTHYTHWLGRADLRDAVAQQYRREQGLDASADHVIVTAGAQEAVYIAFQALLDDGDEVILGDPHYPSYSAAIRLAGGVPVYVRTAAERDFVLEPAAVEAALSPRTKILVIVTPDNPTGAVVPPAVLQGLAEIARRRQLVVMADDIYGRFVFDGAPHRSVAGLPGMAERTIVINGFSKTYAMTGWRVGYAIASGPLAEVMAVIKYNLSICTPAVSQAAALAALTGPQDCVERMRRTYAERRAVLLDGFAALGLLCRGSRGGLFVFPGIASTGLTAYEFCRQLLVEVGVQIFPSTAYGSVDGFVRASFLQPVEVLREALARMAEPVKRWQAARPAS